MNRDNQNREDGSPTDTDSNKINNVSTESDYEDIVTDEQGSPNDEPNTIENEGKDTPLEEQDENNPNKSSTPESGAYLVCKGALCKCNEGSLPFVKLKITSHSKYYVNDMQGAQKLVATVADNTFPPAGFGTCRKKNNNPCSYVPRSLWKIQAEEEHPVANGQKILTTNGSLDCEVGGVIKILTSGQIQTVSESDIEDYTVDLSTSLNCLVESQDIIEKEEDTTKYGIPKIMRIELSEKGSISKNIILRCDEVLTFKAIINGSWEQGKTPDKDRVSWSVWKREDDTQKLSIQDASMQTYTYYGEEFVISFNKEGRYSIEGFGKDPKDRTKNDASCTLTFSIIKENKITDILLPKSTTFKNIPVPISVKTLVEPNAEELEALVIRVADSNNSELFFSKGKTTISYTFINAGKYNIEAYYSYSPDDRLTKDQDIYNNNLLEKLNPDIRIVRKGERINFSVSLEKIGKSDYDNISWDVFSPKNIKIEEGKKGKECPISFNTVGEYRLEIKYKEHWMKKPKTIQHKIKSIVNKVERLECNLKSNNLLKQYTCYVGEEVKITAEMTTKYVPPSVTSNGDGSLIWEEKDYRLKSAVKTPIENTGKDASSFPPTNNKTTYSFIPTNSGKYTISVLQKGQPTQSINILVSQSKIIEWMFTDEYKNYRKYSGWKQKTHIYIKTAGWELREVTVALWLDLRNKKNYVRLNIKELKDKQKVTADGELFIPIGADSDLWALLEQQKYSGDAALYFTVCDIVTDCQNKLDIVYNDVGQRNKHIFRAETKNTYTYIPSQTKATGYFADAEGNVLKRVIDYNTTAYMIVNLINGRKNGLDKYQFTYLINENRPGEDRSVERNRFKPDANGCLKKELPLLGLYGESTHKRDMKHDFRPRLFYFIIYREDKDAKWFPNKTDLCIYPTDYKKDGDNDVYLHIDIQKHTTAEDIKKDKEFKEEQELNIGNIYDTTPRFGVKVYTAPKKPVSFSVVPVKDKTSQELADERNKQIDKKNKEAFPNIESTLGRNYSLQLKVAKDTGINQSLEKISPVIIGEGNRRKAKGECECKKYNLVWGSKVSCEFRKKVIKIAKELKLPQKDYEGANWLMTIFAIETSRSFRSDIGTFKKLLSEHGENADNKKGGYVGLIQFGKSASIDIDKKRSELINLTAEEQLDYVLKYFKLSYFTDKLTSMISLYMAVNYPENVRNNKLGTNDIIYSAPSSAYHQNRAFHKEKRIIEGKEVSEYDNILEYKKDDKGNKKPSLYGFKDGATYIWEVEQTLKEIKKEGISNQFNGICENMPIEPTNSSGKAPWLIFAYEEYKVYKNLRAQDKILKSRIDTYSEKPSGGGHYTAWCASFVNWCFKQTEYKDTNPTGWTFAFDWLPLNLFAKYGKNAKSYYDKNKVIYFDAGNGWGNGESCEPFVGALIIYSFSHIAIIVGQTADGQNYVTLGGNQGGVTNNREICFRTVLKKSSMIIGIAKPKNYIPNEEEKKLPIININETEQLTYENTH